MILKKYILALIILPCYQILIAQTTDTITHKILVVQSNAPKFMREGDKIEFSSTIFNRSDKELTGQITLELIDATTKTSIDGWFQNIFPTQYFTVPSKQNNTVKFPIQIPFSYNKPLIWRVLVISENYKDSEENILAVLSNRSMVTESLPFLVPGKSRQTLKFEKLINQNSLSATNESITLEYCTNSLWYILKSLPTLNEHQNESVEQLFNQFYANRMAAFIITKFPRIKLYLKQWESDSISTLAYLEKNQSLKQILLKETPWVMQVSSENAQQKNLTQLFNLVKIEEETTEQIQKLKPYQSPNGAFTWFKNYYEDRHMTNYILTCIGKLKKLGAITPELEIELNPILIKALAFADSKIKKDYQSMLTNKLDLKKQQITISQIEYLYMRSFYTGITNTAEKAKTFYLRQGRMFWSQQTIEAQAMLALVYERNNEPELVINKILPSILQNAITDHEVGIYWKNNNFNTMYGSQISTQSMVISMVSELLYGRENEALESKISAMETWLVLNKQLNNWGTSIATADACYALLLTGTNFTDNNQKVQIQLGSTIVNKKTESYEVERGYFHKRIEAPIIKPEMGNISITPSAQTNNLNNSQTQAGWGAIYWQYFEESNKMKALPKPLSIQKILLISKESAKGKTLVPNTEKLLIKIGDTIIVKLILKIDRNLEYVHLKDLHAAALEPVDTSSGLKWHNNLGYYQSCNDVSTDFFFGRLNQGTYSFEYPLLVSQVGEFSTGMATLQCLYLPVFYSQSECLKINVTE